MLKLPSTKLRENPFSSFRIVTFGHTDRQTCPKLIGSLLTRQKFVFSSHNTDLPEMYELFSTHIVTPSDNMRWTEYVRLHTHTSAQFSYETNRVSLAGVVPLLQSCCAHSMRVYRALSAPCIGRRDRLVNSGLSGLSGRPTTLEREVFPTESGFFLILLRSYWPSGTLHSLVSQ